MRYILFISLVLTGCATIQMPEGGEVDKYAPVPLKMTPPNESVHFKAQEIVIEFNEFFKLNNPQQQILISPPLLSKPDYQVKGKRLHIKLNEPLSPNTTYNFYFAGAVKDLNEGNDTAFSYVFSTGNSIDSLQLSAWIIDAFTGKPVKDAWVIAYKSQDSSITKSNPDFIARSNEKGTATLKYLPQTPLFVFALEDINYDLRFSSYDERMGFVDTQLAPGDTITHKIRLFQPEDTVTRVKNFKYNHPGQLQLIFNKEINPNELNLNRGTYYDSSRNDTITVYTDSVFKGVSFVTYNINGNSDTTRFYMPEPPDSTKKTISTSKTRQFDHKRGIPLKFPYPIREIDTTKFVLYNNDSIEIRSTLIQTGPFELLVKGDLQPETKYRLKIVEGAITSFHMVSSDSLETIINSYSSDYLSQIKINVKGMDGILQLTKSGKIIREVRVSGSDPVTFKKLPPGKYSFRLIKDDDDNGRWTTGNWGLRLQPETIFYYPQSIELKSGWSIDEEWIIRS